MPARRILITGMSGTGKSAVVDEFVARGHRAIDADYGLSETAPDGDWVWNEALVQATLDEVRAGTLFLAGTAPNQGRFYDQFDRVVLLSAPVELLLARVAARTSNDFGKSPDERARILDDLASTEPLLRRRATDEIVTDRPLDTVVDELAARGGVSQTERCSVTNAQRAHDVAHDGPEPLGRVQADSGLVAAKGLERLELGGQERAGEQRMGACRDPCLDDRIGGSSFTKNAPGTASRRTSR